MAEWIKLVSLNPEVKHSITNGRELSVTYLLVWGNMKYTTALSLMDPSQEVFMSHPLDLVFSLQGI